METYIVYCEESKISYNIDIRNFSQYTCLYFCKDTANKPYLVPEAQLSESKPALLKFDYVMNSDKQLTVEVIGNIQVHFDEGDCLMNDIIYNWKHGSSLYLNISKTKKISLNLFTGQPHQKNISFIPILSESDHQHTSESSKFQPKPTSSKISKFPSQVRITVCLSNVGIYNKL